MPRLTPFPALLALALLAQSAAAQQREISGRIVVQGSERPIPGVEVRLAGSEAGVCTDADGRFYVDAPEGPARLEVRLPAWQGTVQLDGDDGEVTLKVAPHVVRLPAVLVDPPTMDPSQGSSAAHVSAAALAAGAGSSLGTLLQGRVAGASIEVGSGLAGRAASVRLRGINTLFGGTTPLVIIDDVIVSTPAPPGTRGRAGLGAAGDDPFASLNPADVESIEILRGPAGSALYGGLGGNGVVRIRTKRGRPALATTDPERPGVCLAPH
ncbi:MAG: TonB-dependent receptor plug domain-containing protein [Gemmatimonadetes bacterium]|nr:TonB-dependent receptor plug domain-containing protein [Gemmatimonadota bacterium]